MIEIHPQIIQAAGGDLVVLTRAEFDTLMARVVAAEEDEADATLFAARTRDLDEGHDARLPAEVTGAMLSGDSLLRALRKWRGKTQAELSRATNLTEHYIEGVESGTEAGTFDALWAIADALELPEEWVVPDSMKQAPSDSRGG